MPEELHFDSAGLRVAAKAWGPKEGPRWLAVHGWLDSAASFDLLAPALPSWRLHAIDLPGHGLSEWRPPSAFYHFVDWLGVVFDAADAWGWERFNLVGHSLGAGVAALAAATFPERIERLVLLEGLGPLTAQDEEVPERVAAHLNERRRRERKELIPHATRVVAAQRLAKAVPGLSEAGARILVERGTREVEGGVVWRADPRLRQTSPLRLTEGQVLAFLRRVSMPTLVVMADDGWTVPPELVATRLAALPRAEVVHVPGGHHVHLEDAGAVAAVVQRFAEPTGS